MFPDRWGRASVAQRMVQKTSMAQQFRSSTLSKVGIVPVDSRTSTMRPSEKSAAPRVNQDGR